MFAIMQETSSDNPQLLADYYGDNWKVDRIGMLPTTYDSFGDAVSDARRFTTAILRNYGAKQTAEFTVWHSGGIETTFTIFELKHTPKLLGKEQTTMKTAIGRQGFGFWDTTSYPIGGCFRRFGVHETVTDIVKLERSYKGADYAGKLVRDGKSLTIAFGQLAVEEYAQ